MRQPILPAAFLSILALQASPAFADDAAPTGIWERANLLGDIGGLRTMLGDVGVTLALVEQSEVMGNTSGGVKRGFTYDGLTTLTLQVDTAKAFGWEGGTFNFSALQIHGRNLSQYYLDNLQTASGIEAAPTTRLWEAWYQQSLLGGRADVKLGQQSIDQEFITSTGAALFINTAMGWPLLPSADLYAGGPAYPLSSLGVRLRGQPTDSITLLGGVFQDNPPGGPFANDGQLRGSSRYGVNMNLRTGALFIAEAQYAINQPPAPGAADAPKPTGLPTSLKIGVWYDTGSFPNQRTDGSLSGNHSLYAVADQGVWQNADGPQLLSVFARAMTAPGDRNLVDVSLNAGVTLKAPLPGRDDDVFGIGYGYGHISSDVTPTRSAESFVELTYQAQLTPWLMVQPDMQYVMRPNGGIDNPYLPGRRIGNEQIYGVRSSITF